MQHKGHSPILLQEAAQSDFVCDNSCPVSLMKSAIIRINPPNGHGSFPGPFQRFLTGKGRGKAQQAKQKRRRFHLGVFRTLLLAGTNEKYQKGAYWCVQLTN